jgi:hypothetical protein
VTGSKAGGGNIHSGKKDLKKERRYGIISQGLSCAQAFTQYDETERRRAMKGVWRAGVGLLILTAGCTGKQAGGGPGASRPTLMEVTIFPDRPRVGEPIEARVDVRSDPGVPVNLVYQWLRNGIPVPGAGARIFDSKGSRKGDQVSVRVEIQGQKGQIESRRVALVNTAPKILSVSVSPGRPLLGQDLTAVVSAEDADGDRLSYRYQWVKNSQEVPGATLGNFPAGQVQRGDQVAVRVVASDGQDTSETARSLPVTVAGHPPVILSQPPTEMPRQGVFSYQVIARDPEGGPVTYSLVSGPQRMTLDPKSGLLTWPLPEAKGNGYSIVVRASDSDGFTDQAFTLHY